MNDAERSMNPARPRRRFFSWHNLKKRSKEGERKHPRTAQPSNSSDPAQYTSSNPRNTAHYSSSLEDISSTGGCCFFINRKKLNLQVVDPTYERFENDEIADEDIEALSCSGIVLNPCIFGCSRPHLSAPSEILSDFMALQLAVTSPKEWMEGRTWKLSYSTSTHGFSLNSLYRQMLGSDSPTLLVVRDTSHNVFGALVSCSLFKSRKFCGNGQSFLFTFYQQYRKFSSTGANWFYIKGNVDSIVIGSSNGCNGLWLDSSLIRGRTQECTTFNNSPLTDTEYFFIKDIEAWSLV